MSAHATLTIAGVSTPDAVAIRRPPPRRTFATPFTHSGLDCRQESSGTPDCLDEDGQRFIVHSYDLMEAVYELGLLVGVEWED